MKHFNPNECKTVEIKFKNEEEKNKFFTTLIVLLLIVVIVAFLYGKKTNTQEAKAGESNFKVPNPEVRVELAVVIQKYRDIESIDDFVTKTYYLQFAFAINEQERCLMGLKRVRELYQADFKPEALFEYATVIHTHLNHKLKPYLNNGYKPKFASAINIAYKNNLIDSEQRKLLNKLRKYRNIKGHIAGVNFKNKITDMFLNNKINLIESIII